MSNQPEEQPMEVDYNNNPIIPDTGIVLRREILKEYTKDQLIENTLTLEHDIQEHGSKYAVVAILGGIVGVFIFLLLETIISSL